MSTRTEEAGPIYGETIIRQLEHEDVLIVNRLSWLVASQSFLFTAYAIVLNGTSAPRTAILAGRQGELLHIVPTLGLATAGLIYLGVVAGVLVTMALRRQLRKLSPGTIRLGSPLPGTQATHALGLAAPLLLPPVFFAAWVVLLTA